MSRLDFWHPVLLSRELTKGGVAAVRLAGKAIALFRDSRGAVGAVDDKCAHRRMKLSLGRVAEGRLVCPYHGWSYAADGTGSSPANPRISACLTAFAVAEEAGAIWIRAGEDASRPSIVAPDGLFAGAVSNKVKAPIQLVIDAFSEVEHTVAAHPHFGFEPGRIAEARMVLSTAPDSISVRNSGPAKRVPLDTRIAVAMRRDDLFHSDYSFRFDPPRSTVTHRWTDAATGRERRLAYHLVHYFVPEDEASTAIMTFAFVVLRWPFARILHVPVGALFLRRLRQTIEEDAHLLEGLADQDTGLEGMRLGRFDTMLPHTRERLRRIYGA